MPQTRSQTRRAAGTLRNAEDSMVPPRTPGELRELVYNKCAIPAHVFATFTWPMVCGPDRDGRSCLYHFTREEADRLLREFAMEWLGNPSAFPLIPRVMWSGMPAESILDFWTMTSIPPYVAEDPGGMCPTKGKPHMERQAAYDWWSHMDRECLWRRHCFETFSDTACRDTVWDWLKGKEERYPPVLTGTYEECEREQARRL